MVYLDCIPNSGSQDEQGMLVVQVLQRLQNEGLAVSAKKIFFHKREVEFLDFVISNKEVAMSLSKVESVLSWKALKRVWKIQEFIGFVNFYLKFIKNFSDVTTPITSLNKGDPQYFVWGEKQQSVFNKI